MLTQTIDVQTNENQEYISDETILNLDNYDTHDYLDGLQSLTIKKLTYKFVDFTGNENFYMNVELSTDGNVIELKDFFVKEEADNGTVFEITDADKLNAMS